MKIVNRRSIKEKMVEVGDILVTIYDNYYLVVFDGDESGKGYYRALNLKRGHLTEFKTESENELLDKFGVSTIKEIIPGDHAKLELSNFSNDK